MIYIVYDCILVGLFIPVQVNYSCATETCVIDDTSLILHAVYLFALFRLLLLVSLIKNKEREEK